MMERYLAVLVERLAKVFGERLLSATLYGSAAAGDYQARYSDLNVLCVLRQIGPDELELCAPIFRWWREAGNPAPLLMTDAELRRSSDSFPIEFSDMLESRKVLHGADIVAELAVDRRHYRAQLEHELRSALLRLRQQATTALSDRDQLLKLCLDSVSTFCVLGRHGLRLAGASAPMDKRGTVDQLIGAAGPEMRAFAVLLDVREGRSAPQEQDPVNLFRRYLAAVQRLIEFVDAIGDS